MTGCNASIVVGPGRITCAWNCVHDVRHSPHRDNMSIPKVHWTDAAPSAEPHEEPPRYVVANMTAAMTGSQPSWKVVDRTDPEPATWVARFNGPSAETYAREHAARLNEDG